MVASKTCSALHKDACEAGKALKREGRLRRGAYVAALAALLAVEPLISSCAGIQNPRPGNPISAVDRECRNRNPIIGERNPGPRVDDNAVDERRMQEIIGTLRRSTVLIRSDEALGSGVILYSCGGETAILTNRHVVEANARRDGNVVGAPNITIRNDGVIVRPVRVLLAPQELDLALVFVQGDIGPQAAVSHGMPRVGARVLVVGNPLGVEDSVSRGIVSNYVPNESDGGLAFDAIQTDAAINGGNSGGGVFLANGELLGIATFKLRLGTGYAEGMGYALPITLVQNSQLGAWTEIPLTAGAALAADGAAGGGG
ncbi:trypsin-like peptidase domain-containing protein [Candidatus Micrarchaeota archaeon]|nr:trypsin-like peptidase domain-containing protein [Candidatus Micrarchaeota archaeon]